VSIKDTVSRHFPIAEFFKFSLTAGLYSSASFGAYAALIHWTPYLVAFTLSYALGICLAYTANLVFVFKAKSSMGKIMLFPIIQIAKYFVNLLLIYIFVELLFVNRIFAFVLSVAITFPIFFFITRRLIKSKGRLRQSRGRQD
jgi:putative flippase GtrA